MLNECFLAFCVYVLLIYYNVMYIWRNTLGRGEFCDSSTALSKHFYVYLYPYSILLNLYILQIFRSYISFGQ